MPPCPEPSCRNRLQGATRPEPPWPSRRSTAASQALRAACHTACCMSSSAFRRHAFSRTAWISSSLCLLARAAFRLNTMCTRARPKLVGAYTRWVRIRRQGCVNAGRGVMHIFKTCVYTFTRAHYTQKKAVQLPVSGGLVPVGRRRAVVSSCIRAVHHQTQSVGPSSQSDAIRRDSIVGLPSQSDAIRRNQTRFHHRPPVFLDKPRTQK